MVTKQFLHQCVLLGPNNHQKKPHDVLAWENSPEPIKVGHLESRYIQTLKLHISASKGSTELNNHLKMFRRFTLWGTNQGFKVLRLSVSELWATPLFSDPRFWPKTGKSTLYPICLSEVSFPMFIGARNRLQLFV